MISNRNGFGNDYHTEVYVISSSVNDSIAFDDLSYHSATVKNYNGVKSSSTQYNWGSTSMKLSGYTDQYLMTDIVKPINTDDFCIDFWININSFPLSPLFTDVLGVGFFKGTGKPVIPDMNNYCAVRISPTYGDLIFEYISGGTAYFQVGTTGNFQYNINTWYHITAVRHDFSYLKLFVDGTLVSSNLITSYDARTVKNLDYQMLLYHRSSATTNRAFYVDVWRHSVGNSRWITEFTKTNRYY